jgi:hypothetical protein
MQIPKLGKNDRFIQIMEKETLNSINNFKRGHFLEIHFHNKQKIIYKCINGEQRNQINESQFYY